MLPASPVHLDDGDITVEAVRAVISPVPQPRPLAQDAVRARPDRGVATADVDTVIVVIAVPVVVATTSADIPVPAPEAAVDIIVVGSAAVRAVGGDTGVRAGRVRRGTIRFGTPAALAAEPQTDETAGKPGARGVCCCAHEARPEGHSTNEFAQQLSFH